MEFESFHVKNVAVLPDLLLASTENPLHRAMLLNFRRHTLLELSGRWEEILIPEMTVDHPVYRLTVDGKMREYVGKEEVGELYRSLTEAEIQIAPLKETMAVSDSGVYAEQTLGSTISGAALQEQGEDVDDINATYVVTFEQALVFLYTDDARLIGEHVYGDPDSRKIFKLPSEDTLTFAEARESLRPLLENSPLPPFL